MASAGKYPVFTQIERTVVENVQTDTRIKLDLSMEEAKHLLLVMTDYKYGPLNKAIYQALEIVR